MIIRVSEFDQFAHTFLQLFQHFRLGSIFFLKRGNRLPAEFFVNLLNLFDNARLPAVGTESKRLFAARRQTCLLYTSPSPRDSR